MWDLIYTWRHSPNMRQKVVSIDVYERDLRIGLPVSGGLLGNFLGVRHRAAVARTACGDLYLIEKGVSSEDDNKYKRWYRKGTCRIVLVTSKELQDSVWIKRDSVSDVSAWLTLQRLFDSCGKEYSLLSDNCRHGVQKMLEAAKPRWYEGLDWRLWLLLLAAALWWPALLFVMICTLIFAHILRRFAVPTKNEIIVLVIIGMVIGFFHSSQ